MWKIAVCITPASRVVPLSPPGESSVQHQDAAVGEQHSLSLFGLICRTLLLFINLLVLYLCVSSEHFPNYFFLMIFFIDL